MSLANGVTMANSFSLQDFPFGLNQQLINLFQIMYLFEVLIEKKYSDIHIKYTDNLVGPQSPKARTPV